MSHTMVVIPCYNEDTRLQSERFIAFVDRQADVQLLMIDDGSSDQTWPLLLELARSSRGRIHVQRLPQNQGKAEAVRQGLLSALCSRPKYVGYWDADLATPLEDIPRFSRVLDERSECQLVMGVRIQLLGRQIRRTRLRKRLGKLFVAVASWALGIPFTDTQCGAKLARVTPRLRAILAEPFAARWIFDVELIARLVKANVHVDPQRMFYEYSLDDWQDVAGSRLKLRDFAAAPRELGAIYWKYGRVGANVEPQILPLPHVPPPAKPVESLENVVLPTKRAG